ncbi:MAG: MopE-related protein, partial [Myxococcota bacterium]
MVAYTTYPYRLCLGFLVGTLVGLVSCSGDDTGQYTADTRCVTDADCDANAQCVESACVDDSSMAQTTPERNDTGIPPDTNVPPDTTPVNTSDVGRPCTDGEDCISGYCIEEASGNGRICTDFCDPGDSDSCPENFTCASVANSAQDRIFLCFPESEFLCAPCQSDNDCGGLDDRCLEMTGGTFCGRSCAEQNCPMGFGCVEETGSDPQCRPVSGTCSDCIDDDGDGYGQGEGCLGLDCNESDRDVHEGAEELCNMRDDNCNELIDESFDLQNDLAHCGACNAECAPANATALCVEGSCTIGSCDEGWGDCNGDPSDGCEVDLTAPDSCGTCAALGGT